MVQALEKPKLRKFDATVIMVKPYTDSWGYNPSKKDVLEALADLIKLNQLDSHFQIEIRE